MRKISGIVLVAGALALVSCATLLSDHFNPERTVCERANDHYVDAQYAYEVSLRQHDQRVTLAAVAARDEARRRIDAACPYPPVVVELIGGGNVSVPSE